MLQKIELLQDDEEIDKHENDINCDTKIEINDTNTIINII